MSAPLGYSQGSGANAGIKKIFATQLSDLDTFDKEGVGTIRQEGNKKYKYVRFVPGSATVAITAGKAVYYKTISSMTVTGKSADGLGSGALGAGLAVAAQAGTDTVYGWIQVRGLCSTPDAAGAIGGGLKMGTDGALAQMTAHTDFCYAVTVDNTGGSWKVLATFPY